MPEEDPKPPAPAPKADEGKFTQDQVNTFLADQKRKLTAQYADYDELKAKVAKADEAAESSKSDVVKLTEQIEKLTKAQAESDQKALRAEVAMAKGLTPAQAKRLAGASREELEADADEIIEAFPVAPSEDPAKSGPPSRQPRPDLKGGGDPTEEATETDPAKLAATVQRL